MYGDSIHVVCVVFPLLRTTIIGHDDVSLITKEYVL